MKRPPRVVIVGAAGRLGQALEARFSRENSVIGLARPRIDLSCAQSIRDALEPLDFDYLILPAAMTAVDPCETGQDHAYAINAYAPRLIAEICAAKKAHMTHVSTDFVFDGKKPGPYTEEDKPRPVSVYGASKLEGEEHVLAASTHNLVVRVSWLYGPGKAAFPEWITDKACAEAELYLPADKIGTPTCSVDVAELLEPLIFAPGSAPASGLFHLCNSGVCTWQEWGQACIDLAREAGAPIQPNRIAANSLDDIAAMIAKRPPNSAMSNSKYISYTGITPRSWQEALRAHFASAGFLRKYQVAA
jgi:dTDP-4-dehydrorhamnose reductase